MDGEADNDVIEGGNDDDFLFGGDGNDQLFGQAGNDSLFGENGDDQLSGGDGSDNLTGGDGDRRPSRLPSSPSDGPDEITDFVSGIDKIHVSASGFGGGLIAGGTVSLVSGTDPTAIGGYRPIPVRYR